MGQGGCINDIAACDIVYAFGFFLLLHLVCYVRFLAFFADAFFLNVVAQLLRFGLVTALVV